MLQNARFEAFTFADLVRENQQGDGGGGGGGKNKHPPPAQNYTTHPPRLATVISLVILYK